VSKLLDEEVKLKM
jgi:hypothetical protein